MHTAFHSTVNEHADHLCGHLPAPPRQTPPQCFTLEGAGRSIPSRIRCEAAALPLSEVTEESWTIVPPHTNWSLTPTRVTRTCSRSDPLSLQNWFSSLEVFNKMMETFLRGSGHSCCRWIGWTSMMCLLFHHNPLDSDLVTAGVQLIQTQQSNVSPVSCCPVLMEGGGGPVHQLQHVQKVFCRPGSFT